MRRLFSTTFRATFRLRALRGLGLWLIVRSDPDQPVRDLSVLMERG